MDIETESELREEIVESSEEWWKGAVYYQVYPRSFYDSNNDGTGDLQGIIQKLPYVSSLGVDAIWISPFFKSPMKDGGYDVSDYRAVAAEFGTLADFEELLNKAHEIGLKVLIDLVISHTSDKHPWFQESRVSRNNSKSNWYVWANPKPDGTVPNNWLSIFGGTAWQWCGERSQYYLHNFLASQPDLNFHNKEVQKELLDLVDFWLAKGVDGFRLDTVNFYFCDQRLRYNPPLEEKLRNSSTAPMVNPYNHQFHVYDKNRPENLKFLERFRKRMNNYSERTSLGEVGESQRGQEIVGQYTKGNKRLHSCYSFEFLSGSEITPEIIGNILLKFEKDNPESWSTWAISNHDVERVASRWSLGIEELKLISTLIMCLRGSVCIYQGEELGLSEAAIDHHRIRDPYGKEFWPEFKGRDGCRTPMVWEESAPFGGFSNSVPWLPIPEEHLKNSVNIQEKDENSLLNHYRKINLLRKKFPALRHGSIKDISFTDEIIHFKRIFDGENIHCIFNFSKSSQELSLSGGVGTIVMGEPKAGENETGIVLEGSSFAIVLV